MAEIELSRRDGIATILLNRPERRNALSSSMMRDLALALAEIEGDNSARAVIVSGAGRVFCAGLDLGAMGASPTEPTLERELVDRVLRPLEILPKPTIAAMNGDALAGGLELALHCDIRIAVPSARLGMPVARLGIVVPYALILKLLDTVGAAVTSELLFTAEAISAKRAHELAMVNHLATPEALEDDARRVAEAIAANAPLAVHAMKRAILAGRAQRVLEPPESVRVAAERARASEDAREGIRAILDKRRPDFCGR